MNPKERKDKLFMLLLGPWVSSFESGFRAMLAERIRTLVNSGTRVMPPGSK